MEFGISMFGALAFDSNTGKYQVVKQRLKELVEQVQLADELGIDVFAVGEHHSPDFAVSSPEIILSALSTVTKKIKLTSGVTILSTSDPVKVYEQFATVDLLSDERSEIIVGRGGFKESFELFGYDLKDYDELFVEKLDLLIELNRNKSVTWKGKFRPSLTNQTAYPQAERQIPIWVGIGKSRDTVLRAAALGFPIMLGSISTSPIHALPLVNYYIEQYKLHGHEEANMQIGVQVYTIMESGGESLENWYGNILEGPILLNNGQQAVERIIMTIKVFHLTRFVAHLDTGGLSHRQIMNVIELYGKNIIPKVKRLLL